MDATLTLSGSPSRLSRVLEFWDQLDSDDAPSLGLEPFARGLTEDGRKAVRAICDSSSQDKRIDQDELSRRLELTQENELYGVMGGIGYRWARTMTGPNPFIRKSDTATTVGYYQVDKDFASDVIEALNRTAGIQVFLGVKVERDDSTGN